MSVLLIAAGLGGLLSGAGLLVRGAAALAAPRGATDRDRPRRGRTRDELGVSALIRPIAFERRTLRFDLPAMTVGSLALWLLALDGSLSRVDGIILCLGGAGYTAGIVRSTVRGDREIALGNLLGAGVYNIALILGIAVLAAPADAYLGYLVWLTLV